MAPLANVRPTEVRVGQLAFRVDKRLDAPIAVIKIVDGICVFIVFKNRMEGFPLTHTINPAHDAMRREAVDGSVIAARRLMKTYRVAAGEFTAVKGIDLNITRGEFLSIVGKSGSGKTTLLNLLAGIDEPTGGEITIDGTAVHELRGSRLAAWRGQTIGLVFQFFQLLPTLTVAENVMMPMDFCNTFPTRERRPRALELLNRMGIAEQANKLPSSLSGGQQQRAAIARALANDPPILLADEPTGNLDSHTSDSVLELFSQLAFEGRTVVMVTHERDVSRFATRQVTLADGKIIDDSPVTSAPNSSGKGKPR